MYNILQFVILLANVCCIGYFLYQAGELKGLSVGYYMENGDEDMR